MRVQVSKASQIPSEARKMMYEIRFQKLRLGEISLEDLAKLDYILDEVLDTEIVIDIQLVPIIPKEEIPEGSSKR